MECPRCKAVTTERDPRCPRCGAPLLLRTEPAPARLDRPLDIDRRLGSSQPGIPAPRPGPGQPSATPRPRPPPLPPPRSAPVEPASSAPPAPRPAEPAVLTPVAALQQAASTPDIPDVAADDEPLGSLEPLASARSAAPLAAEPSPSPAEIRYQRAPTWKRLLAWALDLACLGLFAGLLLRGGLSVAGLSPGQASPESGLDWLVDVATRHGNVLVLLVAFLAIVSFVYGTLSHALMGATLGKRLVGLRVVTRRGLRPSIAWSALRSALALVSFGLLGLGMLAALFTRSHRALHDLLAGTYVVEAP